MARHAKLRAGSEYRSDNAGTLGACDGLIKAREVRAIVAANYSAERFGEARTSRC